MSELNKKALDTWITRADTDEEHVDEDEDENGE